MVEETKEYRQSFSYSVKDVSELVNTSNSILSYVGKKPPSDNLWTTDEPCKFQAPPIRRPMVAEPALKPSTIRLDVHSHRRYIESEPARANRCQRETLLRRFLRGCIALRLD